MSLYINNDNYSQVVVMRRRKQAAKLKVDNTYNLGYLSKPAGPTWTDPDGTEG